MENGSSGIKPENKDYMVVSYGETTITQPVCQTVRVPEAFSLQRDGKVVAAVDAVYDFSKVDPQYHETLLWFISVSRRPLLLLPSARASSSPAPEPAREKKSWLKRWFGTRG